LVRFNKSTQYINVFSTKEGIAHNEFNRISSFKAEDGRMYFGGIDGLTTFHPRDFETDKSAEQIPLEVTGLFQFLASKDQLRNLTHELHNNQKIILRPGDKFFRLEFALLDFRFPVNNYRYQIEGLDKEWQYTAEPLIRISGLPYGNYSIRIAGQSYSGAWSKQELAIPIHVLRPFYIRWWAFIIYGLGFICFLYFFRQNQFKRALQNSENVRLQELDSLKTKLYNNITHEFRTPLTVIIGMAGQLAEQENQEVQTQADLLPDIQKKSNLILRNARSLLQLINQMLDLSKLDNKKMTLDWVKGDIVAFLLYLSESYSSYAIGRGIQFMHSSPIESLKMDYDQEKLYHIISNLISNSFKYTPEGGTISFQVNKISASSKKEPQLQLKISDSGVGIAKENLPLIFDRFYQADDSYTRKGEGTGIGLAYTKELVELMGGNISVKSEIGQGAEFTVLLPIHNKAIITADINLRKIEVPVIDKHTNLSVPLLDQESEESPLLLIIEDNADVATYIHSCLTVIYRVQWAKNGQLGIDMAIELIPDIIISDIMMPEKDGYEVTQFLKNDERTSHIPIILLTGKADIISKIAGLERGADVYLSKPFDKQELLVRIKNLIKLRKRLQIRYSGQAAFNIKNTTTEEAVLETNNGFLFEDAFLKKVNTIIEIQLSNSEFTIPQLSKELNMSQSQLYRKIKAITGKTITAYLRRYRLHQSRILLQSTTMNISEVAYEVGFADPLYFSRMFSEEYGIPPKESRK
jgi:signal transduction histidine kinase/DNA-binding response OmpR family regulator